jgi:hypothetical protein
MGSLWFLVGLGGEIDWSSLDRGMYSCLVFERHRRFLVLVGCNVVVVAAVAVRLAEKTLCWGLSCDLLLWLMCCEPYVR